MLIVHAYCLHFPHSPRSCAFPLGAFDSPMALSLLGAGWVIWLMALDCRAPLPFQNLQKQWKKGPITVLLATDGNGAINLTRCLPPVGCIKVSPTFELWRHLKTWSGLYQFIFVSNGCHVFQEAVYYTASPISIEMDHYHREDLRLVFRNVVQSVCGPSGKNWLIAGWDAKSMEALLRLPSSWIEKRVDLVVTSARVILW